MLAEIRKLMMKFENNQIFQKKMDTKKISEREKISENSIQEVK